MSRLIDSEILKESYIKSVSIPEVEINYAMELIDRQPTAYDSELGKETLKEFFAGNWVDSDRLQLATGLSFIECYSMFDFSRDAVWWSVAGKTEEERAREGQCITTKFRLRPERIGNGGTGNLK
ncbi:hypothetical protein C3V36_11120 [Lachnospiraceae bacterium oral taxon 500]|nr:hypothetical protein C3V36_11120 [Lachnospiraceae bacterium oral taxon 500]